METLVARPLFSTLSNPLNIALALFTLTGLFLTYRVLLSPLASLPGPRITAVTSLWLKYQEFKGERTVKLDLLHQIYGPVVRISPSEVSFNSYTALKEIYGMRSDFSKSDFYDLFVYYDERNTFTSLDRPNHSAKKKVVADRYHKSYVMQDQVANKIQTHASNFLSQVKRTSGAMDVYTWLHYYALDCITGHLYGTRGTQTLVSAEHRGIVYDLSGVKHRTRLYTIYYFGPIMAAWDRVCRFSRKLWGKSSDFHVRGTRLNDYGKESVFGFRQDQMDKDTVSTCHKLFKVAPGRENYIAAECMDHLVAGVDTTGDAMCILMWRLSTPEYRHVQDRMLEELQSVAEWFDETSGTAPIGVLDKLPYLDAVIHEGLRWRAPVPMTLFRVVPSGGGREIAGCHVPAGTIVGCQAYSLHRLPDVFPEPDRFDPDRWLTEDETQLRNMKAHFWPFSSGGRMCLGHNLAMVEMKILMASVYRAWTTTATEECTEESMRMDDQLTSGVPYALSCKLEFKKR